MPDEPLTLAEAQPRENWHTLHTAEVIHQLATPLETGLTSEEASRRLVQYGPNQLAEAPRPGFLAMLWEQLNNFLMMMLVVAAVVSGIIGWTEFVKSGKTTEFIDAGAILAIVILNAVLGIVQERRAEQELAALKKLAAPEANVLRDGHRQSLPARQLVPGDIVLLEAGN
jgi:Ca2+-transporting ATPase